MRGLVVGVRPQRRAAIIGVSLCAAACAFALSATLAHADENIHRFVGSFAPLSGFANPLGVAINQSTEVVYVADYSAGVVYAFEASGGPDPVHPKLTQADGVTPFSFSNPHGVAVDNSGGPDDGDVYVANNSGGSVTQFDPNGARTSAPPITIADVPVEGTVQSGGLSAVVNNGGFVPAGVAVGPDGDIFVADQSNNVVDRFGANGTFISQLGAGQISGPNLITADASGDLYVANGTGTIKFEPSGVCANSCAPIDPAGSLGVAVDKAGDVFTDEGGLIVEFNPSGQQLQTFGRPFSDTEPPFSGLSFSFGLAVNESTEDVYVTDFSGSKVDIFEPYLLHDAVLPTVGETSSSQPTPTTADLEAQISPGFRPTIYHFQYGLTASYGSSTPISKPMGFADNTDHLEFAQVLGLTPGTTYHFRVVAVNFLGTTHGPDHTLVTPSQPEASAASASNLTATTATLSAEINPELAATTYHFEYGTGATYGSNTSESSPIGADDTSHGVHADLGGLAPDTMYHFRVVATNRFGTTDGLDQSFTTMAAPLVNGQKPPSCKKGLVRRRGKCVKRSHAKPKHHKRGGKR